MINIMNKIRKRRNSKNLQIASLKEELLKAYQKIDEKNQRILELFELRDELQNKIKNILEENKELREKKTRKVK